MPPAAPAIQLKRNHARAEIRNPKAEGRKKSEVPKSENATASARWQKRGIAAVSVFGYRPSFGLRVSGFGFRAALVPRIGDLPGAV
jgi:hypothetical protein